MFRSLVRQIAVTSIAYGIVSAVGLLLAPFLIGIYSLGGYGQILIARVFLPSGFLALLDFGIGETTTRQVALARGTGRWGEAAGALTLLAVMAVAVGAFVGAVIFLAADVLTNWFDIAPDQRSGFALVLRLTALLQPMLMLSLVLEGVLKGCEKFEVLRSIEIGAAIAQAAGAVYLGLTGWGANWVAVSLLASLVLRFVLAAVPAIAALMREGVRLSRWTPHSRQEIGRWTGTMFSSKIVGICQNQLASPLIGLLINPAAVGLYDAVVRLPRFAKVVFGLISSTVLPLASRLRSVDDQVSTGRLAYYGMLGTVFVSWPMGVACAALSKPLLDAWIDAHVSRFWVWQTIMFMVTLAAAPISFGGSVALADRTAARQLVRVAAVQVAIQFPLSFALVPTLHQWAFILANAIAVLITSPFQYHILHKALYIDRNLPLRFGMVLFACCLISVPLAAAHTPSNVWQLALQAAISVAASLALAGVLALDANERTVLIALVRDRLKRVR